MRIVVAGGTGFIGRPLCLSLSRAGHQVILLTRRGNDARRLFGTTVIPVEWNGRHRGAWEQFLEGTDAVINLAGAPIADARWTTARKQVLKDSRILTTRLLVEAMAGRRQQPHTLISASGIGYYGASDDDILDEAAPRGQGFLADLCVAWEAEALRAAARGVRVVLLRTGMVLEQDGGALAKMLWPFRLCVGGPVMPGTQWVSWIHRDDYIGLVHWALQTRTVSGPVNAVAPAAVTMHELCRTLGRVLHRPSWAPVPGVALNLLLGEMATMLTTGQRISPGKALDGGFVFRYPVLTSALRAIFASESGRSLAYSG